MITLLPEFRAAFVGYLDWGTRLAMSNSQPGADVVQQTPVPRWGWAWRLRTCRPTEPPNNEPTDPLIY